MNVSVRLASTILPTYSQLSKMVLLSSNNSNSHTKAIDLSSFDPMTLRDQIAFESAMSSLETRLFDPGVDKVKLVGDLMSVKHLFELVFSCTCPILSTRQYALQHFTLAVGDSAAEYLQDSILRVYPIGANEFMGSQAQQLLDKLSHFAVAFELLPSSREDFRTVQPSVLALSAMATIFNGTPEDPGEPSGSPVSPSSPTRKRRTFSHASQREQKKAARSKGSTTIDPKPFTDLGVDKPLTQEEANNLIQRILLRQRDLLEVCGIALSYLFGEGISVILIYQ